jgi:hypothetical protein
LLKHHGPSESPNPHNEQITRHANEQAPTTNAPWIPRSSWSTHKCRLQRAGNLPRISRSSCCSPFTLIWRTERSPRSEGFTHPGSAENRQHGCI